MNDRYMGIKELVKYSGLSERKLRDLLDEIPHYQPGKKILVKRSEFDEWINNYRVHEDDLHPVVRRMKEALRWEDISFKRGQIYVWRNHPHGRELTKLKSRAGRRYIEMTEDLAAALKQWKKDLRAERLESGETQLPSLVYVNRESNPFDYSNFLNRYWNRVLIKAGVDERNPHQLRHTFASRLIMAGVPLTRVAYLLGHSSPRITLDYYAHFMPSEEGSDLSGILDASKTQTKRKRLK